MSTFDYRRELTARELIPALGVGVGVGIAVAYLVQILLRREPVRREPARSAGGG